MSEDRFSYALTNPLSQILNKPPRDFQREDLLSIIEKNQIERITFHYTALDGRLKELMLPVSGRKRAEKILAEGERVDGSSLFKGMVETALSDVYVVPEYRTAFFNPFDQGSLDFICRYVTQDGERASFAPDNILAKAHSLFRENSGLDLYALGEIEFYLISAREPHTFQKESQGGYHESSPFLKRGDILTEIVRHITQITDAVKYAHSEVGFIDKIESELEEIDGQQGEQMEVEFLPRPVEEMADAMVLTRWLIRNVAFRHGCVATFSPKIEDGVAGNGMHVHLQLMEEGQNIMEGPDGRLSEKAMKLVGGLCHYADSLVAFGNTVASSYMRLVPHQEAPTKIFWSGLNRSALIRVPLAWSEVRNIAKQINPQEESDFGGFEKSKTIELRSADGSALIHLLLAGISMAADWGFRTPEALALAEKLYVTGRISDDEGVLDGFSSLPANCVESSQILAQKRDLYEREDVFPIPIVDYVIDLLKREDFDLKGYGRIEDLRKVMHKDLHRH
ncbi:MAG: glutamine synthetase [Candidatus Aminicenantes bacterium]|nr:glutamine synthetase [Candidatus Aminicenantes bacterium]